MACEIVPKWRLEHHELAKHLRAVFERTGVEAVLDVGANHGQYHDFLRLEVGYEGLVHSFEPIKKLYDELKSRAASEPNWKIHHCAMGRSDGEVSINIMRDDQFTSVLSPRQSGLTDCDFKNSVREVQPVALRRLESVIAANPDLARCRNIYLKIDTQGFDLEVFGGIGKAIDKVVALQSEVSFLPLYDGMPDYRTSISTYNAAGFEVSGLFPIARDQFLRVIEFDCVTVNPKRVALSPDDAVMPAMHQA